MNDEAAADRRGVCSAFPFRQFVGINLPDVLRGQLFLDYPCFLLRLPSLGCSEALRTSMG